LSVEGVKQRGVWIIVALVLAAAWPLGRCAQEWLSVDACLDGGGAWIDAIKKCSHDQQEIDRYKPR
jgi:hypothetical protein